MEVDRARNRRLAARRSLRPPRHFDPFDVEQPAVDAEGLVGEDAVDVDRHRRIAEEVDGSLRAEPPHVVVIVLVLARTFVSIADLQTGNQNLEVVGVLDAQLLDHLGVEAGYGHRPIKNVDLAAFARDDHGLDVLTAAFVRVVLLVLGLVGLGGGSTCKERQ